MMEFSDDFKLFLLLKLYTDEVNSFSCPYFWQEKTDPSVVRTYHIGSYDSYDSKYKKTVGIVTITKPDETWSIIISPIKQKSDYMYIIQCSDGIKIYSLYLTKDHFNEIHVEYRNEKIIHLIDR